MSTDLSGQRLGHYQVEGMIGRGGMSVVYRALDTRLDRPVALKVMSEALSTDPEFRVRFTEEAKAASAIDHVNVVPLYDFGEAQGWLFIAMRLVNGTDLAREVAYGPLPVRRVLDLLGQVGAALDMLHERGLVHLDVKPANVLITRNESSGSEHVYVGDFGLTRRGTTGHRTSSGDFLGSPSYASPEHLRGQEILPASDLYSLTCMLFTCLAGHAPFTGEVTAVITGHLRGQVPSLSAMTGLNSAIDRVIARGMAADPAARYLTSADLLGSARRALTSLRDEDPIPAPTPSPEPAAAMTRPAGPPLPDRRGGLPPAPSGPSVSGPSVSGPLRTGPGQSGAGQSGPVPSGVFPSASGSADATQIVGSAQPKVGRHVADISDRYPVPPGPGYLPQPGGYPPQRPMDQRPMEQRPMEPSGPVPAPPGSTSGRWLWAGVGVLVIVAIVVVVVVLLTRRSTPEAPVRPTESSSPAATTGPSGPVSSRATGTIPSGVLPTLINPSLISRLPGVPDPLETSR